MRGRPLLAFYAFAAFWSAFLLFALQPMLGKRVLPWFGGTPGTWTTCLLFFQSLLFLGYVLAHVLVTRVRATTRLVVLVCLLGAALALLPVGPAPHDRPTGRLAPELELLWLLLRHAGLPYLVLASSAPLLQHFFSLTSERSPYVLFAFSNAGSLSGLLAYPVLIEPALVLSRQGVLWSWGFASCSLCLATAALLAARPAVVSAIATPSAVVSRTAQAQWFLLSATASALLLAVTNQLTVDVAAVPFLWVAPLSLYLVTFILAFGSERAYPRKLVLGLWLACMLAVGVDSFRAASASLGAQLATWLLALFAGAWLCHGELSRARPDARLLSRFYLVLAAGGAAGGLTVALLAPLLFTGVFELPLILVAIPGLVLWRLRAVGSEDRTVVRLAWLGVGLCAPLALATFWVHGQDRTRSGTVVEQRRNFYGVLRVTDLPDVRMLSHGRIRHGMQFRDPARAGQATMYYGASSGAGRALRLHAPERPRRIGVVGLGAGTLAALGEARDTMRFYELNPDVLELARRRFTFLSRSPARTEVALGDGRLLLEREPPQRFDLLLLDAFASDSVPVHLLTVEAFAVYLRHLAPAGLLLANVSNRHLDVERVVAGSASAHRLSLAIVETPSDAGRGLARVRWGIAARDPRSLRDVLEGTVPEPLRGSPVRFTDSFSNLFQVLR